MLQKFEYYEGKAQCHNFRLVITKKNVKSYEKWEIILQKDAHKVKLHKKRLRLSFFLTYRHILQKKTHIV